MCEEHDLFFRRNFLAICFELELDVNLWYEEYQNGINSLVWYFTHNHTHRLALVKISTMMIKRISGNQLSNSIRVQSEGTKTEISRFRGIEIQLNFFLFFLFHFFCVDLLLLCSHLGNWFVILFFVFVNILYEIPLARNKNTFSNTDFVSLLHHYMTNKNVKKL